MTAFLAPVFEPGFFESPAVRSALLAGAVVALVSAAAGVFAVMRGESFAGEALSDLGATGGSGAYLIGINALWGFVAAALVGALGIDLAGSARSPARDLSTGIILGGGLGLAALFLDLDARTSTTGASTAVLFGSLFVISSATVWLVAALGGAALAVLLLAWRMLLLASLSPDLAAARGVRVRLVGVAYLLALALAVSLAALTIGAVLGLALLVGPAAAALRLTRRPGAAVATAAAIGVGATSVGILLAWDSYAWPPAQVGWPVSFFVVAIVLLAYLASLLAARGERRRIPAGPGHDCGEEG